MFCVNRDASLVAQWMFCCNYMADILLGRLPRNLRSLQSLYGRAAVAVVSVNGLWIGVCIVWFNSNLLWAVFLCLTTLMCRGGREEISLHCSAFDMYKQWVYRK